MFSLSSCSDTLSAGLALTLCLDGFVFDCACSEDDIRRGGTEEPAVATGFVMGNLEYEDALPVGVGVPAVDLLRSLAGGGSIAPSLARAGFDTVWVVDPAFAAALFTRTLFPRAEILADDESVSVDGFRSLAEALVSDMTEEAREEARATLGVADSR